MKHRMVVYQLQWKGFKMIRQCEICGKFHDKTYDASELAIIFHVSPRDNSTNDPNKFIICKDCYNDIERAIATAWLSQLSEDDK